MNSGFIQPKGMRALLIPTVVMTFAVLPSLTHADEQLSLAQTTLSSATIGGYVDFQATLDFSEAAGSLMINNSDLIVVSLEPYSLSIETAAHTINLLNVSFDSGAIVNLRSFYGSLWSNPNTDYDSVPGYVNFINGVSYGGVPSGLAPPKRIHITPLDADFTPSIQPAPEPSTIALGSLALGLISLVRRAKSK